MPEYLAPGVFVEEVSFRAKSIEGVSTSTCGFVGPTRKGPLGGTPELITNFGDFERMFGGYAELGFVGAAATPNYMAHAVRAFFENGGRRLYVARVHVPDTDGNDDPIDGRAGYTEGPFTIRARSPGSGYNGEVRIHQKVTRIVPGQAPRNPLDNAPNGSLLRLVNGDPAAVAQPAALDGGRPPFVLSPGDTLTLRVNGNPQSVTFQAAPAEVQSDDIADPGVIPIPADASLTITVDGRAPDVIALPVGNQTAADLALLINNGVSHAKVNVDGAKLVVRSDRQGTGASVTVSQMSELGFPAERSAAGTGNVADIEAVSLEEIRTLFTAVDAGVRVMATQHGLLRIMTENTGTAATLSADDTPARASAGLPGAAAVGTAGATYSYYLKNGNTWADAGSQALPAPANNTVLELVTLDLEAQDADNNVVIYQGLGFADTHPHYIGTVLSETPTSKAERLQNPFFATVAPATTAFALREALFGSVTTRPLTLTGGADGVPPALDSDTEGAVAYSDALEQLAAMDDIAIVAAPGHTALGETTYHAVQNALITHAELSKYRVAVLETAANVTVAEARAAKGRVDSTYAALYYPWVTVSNPLWRLGSGIAREIDVPPSGFVAGIYARTDVNRGVWKAPANEVVRGALRFEQDINRGQQEVLNPEGINCLRYFPGRGYRVWGARTASSDPEWKYLNVRRYFIYLEHSIDRSTQWAVFEPNGERLWANVTATVTAFLYNEWRSGALLGGTPEQAFFVRCDRSTMTQADLDNGRMICEIGVAALKPAEFVIFRIGQKTADAD